MRESIEAIKEIKIAVLGNKLIPFVGAGFSANIEGYPTWKKSVEMLEKQCYGCKDLSNDYLEAYQYAYWLKGKGEGEGEQISTRLERGKKELKKSFLDIALKQPLDNLRNKILTGKNVCEELKQHILLVNNFHKIYTTNWDKLIEFTCEQMKRAHESYYAIVGKYVYGSKYHLNKEISNNDKIVKIIKYHGCICDETATSIIASSADYHERISSLYVHPLDQELYWDMREKNIMFIGYSLSDINIKYIMNQVLFEAWRQPESLTSSKFYLIELGEPRSEEVLDYWSECIKITPVYLFVKDHFYHDLVKISKEKWDGKDFVRICEERKIKDKILSLINSEVKEDAFLPITINDIKELTAKLLKTALSLEELNGLIRIMRKKALINFLKYITNE